MKTPPRNFSFFGDVRFIRIPALSLIRNHKYKTSLIKPTHVNLKWNNHTVFKSNHSSIFANTVQFVLLLLPVE